MTRERTELELIYGEHGSRLWRSLPGFTGDPEVASDALAEVSIRNASNTIDRGAEQAKSEPRPQPRGNNCALTCPPGAR